MGFRDRFFRFMEGRYGLRAFSDSVQLCIVGVYVVLVVVNLFARSRIIGGLQTALLLYTLFRMLSKNIPARENEARIFSAWKYKMQDAWRFREARAQEAREHRAAEKARRETERARKKDKEHIYRECPQCGTTLRLPRKKGKHSVICPRCGIRFGVECSK